MNQKEPLITKIANIKNEIGNLKATNKSLKESEYCPLCKRKFDDVDHTDTIKQNEQKIQELIALGIATNEIKTKLEEEIANMDGERAKFNEKNRLELLVSKYDVELANLRVELKEKKQTLKKSRKTRLLSRKTTGLTLPSILSIRTSETKRPSRQRPVTTSLLARKILSVTTRQSPTGK